MIIKRFAEAEDYEQFKQRYIGLVTFIARTKPDMLKMKGRCYPVEVWVDGGEDEWCEETIIWNERR